MYALRSRVPQACSDSMSEDAMFIDVERGDTDEESTPSCLLEDPFKEAPSLEPSFPLLPTRAVNVMKEIYFRPLETKDREKIQALHEEWFPVSYNKEFYDELVQHRLGRTGERLRTWVASLKDSVDLRQTCAIHERTVEQEEIVGCLVGAFIKSTRLSSETRQLLLPDSSRHSRLFYIMTLGTVDAYRNRGIATALVMKCINVVEEDSSCGTLYLHVIPFNTAAITFYEKLGFDRVKEIKDYYLIDGQRHNCFLYAKYFHGNRGHKTVWRLVSDVVTDCWLHMKAPLVFLFEYATRFE